MTRERLLTMPLGAECVKLAQISSFFSPDGCPRHILLHLWKTVIAPGQDAEKFSHALEIGMRHQIFQSADPVLVNSLDREAILKTAKEEQGLEEAIGKSLAKYVGMSPIDWLLLADHIAILRLIPPDILIAERNPFLRRESFTMSDSAIGRSAQSTTSICRKVRMRPISSQSDNSCVAIGCLDGAMPALYFQLIYPLMGLV